MRPATRLHLRRALRLFPPLWVAWTVAVVVGSRITDLRNAPFGVYDLVGALIVSSIVAAGMAILETRPLSRRLLHGAPVRDMAVRALLYLALVAAMVWVAWWLLPALMPWQEPAYHGYTLRDVLREGRVRWFSLWLLGASFLITYFLHLRLVMGRRHLVALFLGRYRYPVVEDRYFLFVDLVGSTATAERLGPLDFTHYKHDFFTDLSLPTERTDGQIIQYVGDEVMLSWPRAPHAERADPLRWLALAREAIGERHDYYVRRYGEAPRFRAGLHVGEVVVAEVGDLRRDIVYSGDTVNAAARLLQACRHEGVDALVSEAAWRSFPAAFRQNWRPHRALELRGRGEAMGCYAYPAPS